MISGIKRSVPQGQINDGACDELINQRYLDGAWRPIGPYLELYDKPNYELVALHKEDTIENWIGYDEGTDKVEYYSPSTLAVTQTVVTLNGTETLNDIKFQKRFMLVITDENLYVFLFRPTSDDYDYIQLTGLEDNFEVNLEIGDAVTNSSESRAVSTEGLNAESLLGKYYELLNNLSNDSKFIGGVFYRYALKLFDGSYILHTVPKYHQITSHYGLLVRGFDGFAFYFETGGLSPTIYPSGINANARFTEDVSGQWEQLKDIIDSIVIFTSQNQQFYDISEDTITDDNLDSWLPSHPSTIELSEILPVASEFKEDMHDSISWYKIGEVKMSNLVQLVATR